LHFQDVDGDREFSFDSEEMALKTAIMSKDRSRREKFPMDVIIRECYK